MNAWRSAVRRMDYTLPLVPQRDENFDVGADTDTPVNSEKSTESMHYEQTLIVFFIPVRSSVIPLHFQHPSRGTPDQPGSAQREGLVALSSQYKTREASGSGRSDAIDGVTAMREKCRVLG